MFLVENTCSAPLSLRTGQQLAPFGQPGDSVEVSDADAAVLENHPLLKITPVEESPTEPAAPAEDPAEPAPAPEPAPEPAPAPAEDPDLAKAQADLAAAEAALEEAKAAEAAAEEGK